METDHFPRSEMNWLGIIVVLLSGWRPCGERWAEDHLAETEIRVRGVRASL